ncbi:ROK family protein [Candidatus Omnitrophota bacterium]
MKPLSLREEMLNERQRKNLSILEAIKRFGPVSKTDIGKLSGLNIVTVTNYIDHFLRSNIVFEKELDISTGGRRPVLLDLNDRAGYAIGIGMNLLNTVGVVTDFDGTVVHRVEKESLDLSSKEIAQSLIEVIRQLLNANAISKDKIQGVGIGLAGVVNNKTGSVRWPEKLAGSNCSYASVYLPLRDMIKNEFGLSCTLENDATVACFGEQWLGMDADVENLIYMFSGVGCGIMINREIYRGTTGSAGELSIHNAKDDLPSKCDFGSPCLMKRWEADLGLVNEAKVILGGKGASKYKDSKIMELAGAETDSIKLMHIFEAAKQNDALAGILVERAGKLLGIKIAYLVNLLNPQLVIIGGGIEKAGDKLLDAVKETVSRWAFEDTAGAVKIIPSRFGEDSVALGAASLVVRNIFTQI